MSDARREMVASTVKLLAMHGLSGASFSDVLRDSGAPRGSIYHHFPAGKDQLVEEAVGAAGAHALAALAASRGKTAEQVVRRFLRLWRDLLTRTDLAAGCAVLAATVESDSPEVRRRAGAVFDAWRSELADLLVAGGVPRAAATPWATTLIAATEGAVVLARADGDLRAFEQVAKELLAGTRQRQLSRA